MRRAWGPLHGVMLHHTASGEGPGISRYVRRGTKALPGPLCHGLIHKSGEVELIGWGRANHAGWGDWRVLGAVIREDARLPKPGRGSADGNRYFVGFECVNWGDGDDCWPDVQVEAMARASAAVCRVYGWSERSVIGHKEWTSRKIDPRGVSMGDIRCRVKELLR